jgi:hypothetical protein
MASCWRIFRTLGLAVLVGAGTTQLTLSPRGSAEETGQPEKLAPGVTLGSREMAALIVAYEDYRTRLQRDGVTLTPTELGKRHHAVRIRRQGAQIYIYFSPPSELTLGGDVEYVVDAERLQILESIFGR